MLFSWQFWLLAIWPYVALAANLSLSSLAGEHDITLRMKGDVTLDWFNFKHE